MEESPQLEREVRAARNQSLFRAVNEQIKALNEAFESITGTFSIVCECFDTNCIAALELPRSEYEAIRVEPRHFAVLPGHILPDVEDVVREGHGFVVVEKISTAAEVAEYFDPRGAKTPANAGAGDER